MIRLVCINEYAPGLTVGNTYPLMGAEGDWVRLLNDNKDLQLYLIDSTVIFLNEDNYKFPNRKAYYEMLMSYVESIESAGGCSERLIDAIDKMSVDEMMRVLSSNNVRFQYTGRQEYCAHDTI